MKTSKKTNIIIFYGPRNEFDKIIKGKHDKEYFASIVQEYDEEIKSVHHKIDGQEVPPKIHQKRKISNLIVNSDEYSTITEGAIQNITAILDYFEIKNIYFQNPPYLIAEKIKKVYSKIEEKYHKYNKITMDILKEINEKYSQNIIGQENAKNYLLRSLLSFEKFEDNKRPLVLMFYGPSGVGKTETARFLSKSMQEVLFYKQFSMFQNNDFATYLFGGIHSQNSFAKELLDRESNVILLDEFDKANNFFYSAFYQLFDEGIYNDKNYSVKLENAIIICTSNFVSKEEIRKCLGDPIYFRFDGFIPFNELDQTSLKKITDIYYLKYYNQLNEEDRKLIDNFNKDGKNLIELLYDLSDKLINARNIETIVKDSMLQILLENTIKKY